MPLTRLFPARRGRANRGSLTSTMCLAAMCGIAAPAVAQSQNDLVTPTAWFWWANQDFDQISDQVNDGYRIVDIEVESTSPLRLSASFVRDAGDYDKTWWWYLGQTEAQVAERMAEHNARLIDLEVYETPGGPRYAIVLIRNSGQDAAVNHGFETNQTFAQVTAAIGPGSTRRIIDIQPQTVNGVLRYDYIWVQNSGQLASNFAVYLNTSTAFISNQINNLNYRVVDLEPHNDSGTFSAILEPSDGNAWAWFTNMTVSDVGKLAGEYAGRITDLERYTTPGGSIRYASVVRRNDNDLSVSTAYQMRSFIPLTSSSGFLLRRLDGNEARLASTRESTIFEPASLMKTTYLFAAMNEVALGNDSLGTNILDFRGLPPGSSCPDGTNPQFRTLDTVLRDMMVDSDNPATETIRTRYGNALIEATNASVGSFIDINHTIGCFCAFTPNEIRLNDLYAVYDAAQEGFLGSATDDFFDIQLNGSSFGGGSFNTTTALNNELAASSLSAAEQTEFRGQMRYAHKGGSYGCTDGGGNTRTYRSRGAYVSLPFRSGCRTDEQEYFIGSWVNEVPVGDDANDAMGSAIVNLFRDRVRAAIDSWETAVCPCGPGDFNADGSINIFDIIAFLNAWNQGDNDADTNNDGELDIFDILGFLELWNRGCP